MKKFRMNPLNLELGVVHTHLAVVSLGNSRVDESKLDAWRKSALEKALLYDEGFLETHPYFDGFNRIYAMLGYKAGAIVPAALSLVQLVRQRQRIPKIGPVVDCYNCVVLETLISIGAHDDDRVVGDIYFTIADGAEPFIPLGRNTIKSPRAGDFIYRDDHKVLARLAAFDCDDAKLQSGTRKVVLVSEANAMTPADRVREALNEAASRLVELCGGWYEIVEPKPESQTA